MGSYVLNVVTRFLCTYFEEKCALRAYTRLGRVDMTQEELIDWLEGKDVTISLE